MEQPKQSHFHRTLVACRAVPRLSNGVVRACPECGSRLSSGASSPEGRDPAAAVPGPGTPTGLGAPKRVRALPATTVRTIDTILEARAARLDGLANEARKVMDTTVEARLQGLADLVQLQHRVNARIMAQIPRDG